ncbi:MAG: NADH-quinone oxidoreductase subunit J [Acidobacteria bacterium]|nr:NADH-quinone oxidoreductase subunit J [Acidobacteriota bacterium]
MGLNLILFYAFATLAVVTSLLVVAQSNPVHSVLLLIGSFVALAGLYVLLAAPFVAVIQIIVYAGAIMVLFLFVVMLLNASKEDAVQAGIMESGTTRVLGALLALALVAELVWAVSRSGAAGLGSAGEGRHSWSVTEIGVMIFQDYAFAFEATSILILVAMVGAVALAGRHLAEKKS